MTNLPEKENRLAHLTFDPTNQRLGIMLSLVPIGLNQKLGANIMEAAGVEGEI